MNKRIRILVLCLCGAVGIAIAVGVARRPKPASPLLGAIPSSVVTTPVVNAAQEPVVEPAAESATTQEKHKPAEPAIAADPPPAATQTPILVSPAASAPASEAAEESALVTRKIQRLEQTLEDIREENARAQRNLRDTLNEVHDKVQRPTAIAALLPAPPAAPGTPAAKAENLPNPATPIQEEGDGKLTVDWDNTDILDAIKLLNDQGLNILASKSVTGTVTASLTNVDAETALRAILKNAGFVARREKGIIYVGTAADFASMDQSQDTAAMRVYRPNYVKAADLEKLITPMITPSFGKVTVSAAAQVDIPSDQVKTGANDFAGGDVVVVKDYENVLRQIDELFDEVDVKPTQVAIEAMIINVKLNDSNQFGVNFQALRDQANARIVTGNSPLASLATLDVGNGGLKFGFLDGSLSTFLVALEQVGDTSVIASPRVLCMNKQRAEIQIGEQLGYVNTTVTQTFSTQSVSFLDVGTLLRIRPFVGNDGFIRMEVHPELSTGSVTISGGLTLPNKSVTQVTSNVGCYDGSTIVIGGLLRKDYQTTTSQVPFIGSLPWVGPAFRTKNEKLVKDEIIVVITPRIVSEDALAMEGQKLGNEFTHKQDVYFDKMSPIAKRNYALRYQRLALAAYNAGDFSRALRQVDWSIHFDPMSRDAINLRNEIITAGGFEGESIHEYLNRARAPWHRPHRDYSKEGAPWKPEPTFGDEIRIKEERDLGVPGDKKTISLDPPRK